MIRQGFLKHMSSTKIKCQVAFVSNESSGILCRSAYLKCLHASAMSTEAMFFFDKHPFLA